MLKSMNIPPMKVGPVKSREEVRLLSPLTLAFVGDAVQSLYVRTALAMTSDVTGYVLHRRTAQVVRAVTQAAAALQMQELFTEEEMGIFKRGRNAKSGGVPSGATVAEYRLATGLEAVFGYLYLLEETERLHELLEKCLELSLAGDSVEG